MKRLALFFTPVLLFACADASDDASNPSQPPGGKADDTSVCCELDEMLPDTACCDGLWSTECKEDADSSICEDDGAPFDPDARGEVGDPCGSLINPLCEDDLFCKYAPEANCGRADAGGTCAERPDACLEIYSPVCGCDDQTYDNSCGADAAGVSHVPGACGDDGVDVDGFCRPGVGLVCADGLLCDLSFDDSCEAEGNAIGLCITIPLSCEDDDAPVCGCDGETYGSRCEANAAAQIVAADGPC